MDSLPDLSGQPPWVIIVVVGFGALGTIGTALLQRSEKRAAKKRKRNDKGDVPAIEQPRSVPSAPNGQVDVLNVSVAAIIEHARRESDEANEARKETRALRAKYDAARAELEEARRVATRALADLDRCQSDVNRLRAKLDGDDTP